MVNNDAVNRFDLFGLQALGMTHWQLVSESLADPEISKGDEKNKCDCLIVKLWVETGTSRRVNPLDNGYWDVLDEGEKKLPVNSGHPNTLNPSISITWRDDLEKCKCKKKDKAVIVKVQIFNKPTKVGDDVSTGRHPMLYDFNATGGMDFNPLVFSKEQLGVDTNKHVGKIMRITVVGNSDSNKGVVCYKRDFEIYNPGGERNNIPYFTEKPNTPLF